MKLLIMSSGEMEYEQVFRFRDSQTDDALGTINYPFLSNILWAVFVILMPILFINLLVSCNHCEYLAILLCLCVYRLVLLLVTHKRLRKRLH